MLWLQDPSWQCCAGKSTTCHTQPQIGCTHPSPFCWHSLVPYPQSPHLTMSSTSTEWPWQPKPCTGAHSKGRNKVGTVAGPRLTCSNARTVFQFTLYLFMELVLCSEPEGCILPLVSSCSVGQLHAKHKWKILLSRYYFGQSQPQAKRQFGQ